MHGTVIILGDIVDSDPDLWDDGESILGHQEMTNMASTPATLAHTEALSIAEAKTHFSSVITRVEKKQIPVTILRRGVPVAQIVPIPGATIPPLRGSMAGTARELGDIVNPYLEEWTVGEWPPPSGDDEGDSDDR
jgi:prevent-host-death family protein